ncbi:dTDP-4-amino-4,6-dideoxygalactose transaminase [Methylobacterium phyllostachyos]|uniref:dTDP-4-amino-4,6-dideoxygalactose transaminase n=1 Tax=Methylobacterium phyllostachyos TaxID=582672 RepID=A0A1G9R9R2_9HYPH|nr:aminotransferase class I/II-fold pyridoxal phosphate-dependent enzyme [Methylobacterium phyllostachyos]SDM19850.1 dTDP-4-amino-4,6-dideoxygalactose transaminase [Methylobacterium phyllostachyos]
MTRTGWREMHALARVIQSGHLMRYSNDAGGFAARFEAALGSKIGVKHVLAVNSGTSALITALVAAGIGPGDEVLIPAYTWVATAAAVVAVGAIPILVNIDESMTIDAREAEAKITSRTRAIVGVHMLNLVCDLDSIGEMARKNGILVIEDAAQAVGVEYKHGRVGAFGHVGIFSFNQFKNISAGEGGAILTNNRTVFTRARIYHDVGSYTRNTELDVQEPFFAGVNYRVSELTGAVLYAQLSRLDRIIRRLKERRKIMVRQLQSCKSIRIAPHHDTENAAGLVVSFEDRRQAVKFSEQRGVEHLAASGRHIFSNWIPIMEQRTHDVRSNPYRSDRRNIVYDPEDFRITSDILDRSCRIFLGVNHPRAIVYAQAKWLTRAASAL